MSNLEQIVDNSGQEINIEFVSKSPVFKVGEVVQLKQGILLVIGRHQKNLISSGLIIRRIIQNLIRMSLIG